MRKTSLEKTGLRQVVCYYVNEYVYQNFQVLVYKGSDKPMSMEIVTIQAN